MNYAEKIKELTRSVPSTLVDFELPRDKSRTPTQASSNFITNKEQGDWAENLIYRAINETSENFVAVKYGKSDDVIAGEEGFDTFYQEFQDELDTIGKRPDLLIFYKVDYNSQLGYDISQIPHREISDYVRKAVAGIEIRSSAFLIDKYEEFMQTRTEKLIEDAINTRNLILNGYREELDHPKRKHFIEILEGVNRSTIAATDFRVPGWSSTERLEELKANLKTLKSHIKEIQKRVYLSITPKVEDLKVVYRWIETFNVPHFYFQVFFDKVYGVSFEQILEIISDPNNEEINFWIEKDTKNQNKTTIKINPKSGEVIASKVDEPVHESVRKEMGRGRLLFYVTFSGGTAYLDVDNLIKVLGIHLNSF